MRELISVTSILAHSVTSGRHGPHALDDVLVPVGLLAADVTEQRADELRVAERRLRVRAELGAVTEEVHRLLVLPHRLRDQRLTSQQRHVHSWAHVNVVNLQVTVITSSMRVHTCPIQDST